MDTFMRLFLRRFPAVLLITLVGCHSAPTRQSIAASATCYAKSISSWDVQYDVNWEQKATTINGQLIPEMHRATQIHEIVDGNRRWADRVELPQPTHVGSVAPPTHAIESADGQFVYGINGDSGGIDRYRPQIAAVNAIVYRQLLLAATPWPQTVDSTSHDLLPLLIGPDIHLDDAPETINGRTCRVLVKKTSQPMLSEIHLVDRQGKALPQPATKRVEKFADREEIIRIAIDPALGNMPVKLTVDYRIVLAHPQAPVVTGRKSELIVSKAVQTSQGIWVPQDATLTLFGGNNNEPRTIITLHVKSITLNGSYPDAQFVLKFSPGLRFYDAIRHVGYTVGESHDVINQRALERAKQDEFFAGILGKASPPLNAKRWLVGKPLQLANLKGRAVILHFWNIGCAPCVREIPSLQQQYGTQRDNEPVFISIHASGDDADLPEIKKFIKEHGITFPVMLDSYAASDPAPQSWGPTCKVYGVFGIPTDAFIDAEGRLTAIGDHKLEK